MKISRYFSTEGTPVVQQVKWKTIPEVKVEDGLTKEVIFSAKNVEVPEHWSDNAASIIANKYFRKASVPTSTFEAGFVQGYKAGDMPSWLYPCMPMPQSEFGPETSAKQVFHRMAGCWAYWGWREGLLTTEEDAQIFYDEIYMMLALQKAAPNSPQWFNTGLHWAYGIEGPVSGQWAVNWEDRFSDIQEIIYETENSYERPQPHACFIQSIKDDLVNPGGIMDLYSREVRLFKYGSGTGSNFSTLRAKGEGLSGGGVSSGLMSFLPIGDKSAGSIASGGVTRRAAKMVIVDADHPEICEFVDWKVWEEYKAACMYIGSKAVLEAVLAQSMMGQCGYEIPTALKDRLSVGYPAQILDVDWEGIALGSVSGQNSNNSVRVSDEFMNKSETNDSWNLIARTTGKSVTKIRAKDLWEKICTAAWACADPGLLFADTINSWNTCSNDGEIRACNPCGEYQFLDDTACFTGETKVWTMDGPRKFDELSKEGKTIQVLTQLEDGSLAYRDMISPRRTRRNSKILKVTFKARGARGRKNSFTTVRCTPDHVFYLRDGSERKARELIPGDRIQSAYSYDNEEIYNSYELVRDYTLLAEYKYGRRPNTNEHAHHVDKNHANRNLDNIEIKLKASHIGEHSKEWFKNATPEQLLDRSRKISVGNTGKVRSSETIEKLRVSHTGKKQSAESVTKRIAKNTGKKRSEDTKSKMRSAVIRRKENGTFSVCAGRVWITNGRQNKRVVDLSAMPEGWWVGRVIKHVVEQRPDNHTVESVEVIEELCDVYCGTVPSTGKFFLALGDEGREGVLVHNCNLASLNLVGFLRSGGSLDLDGLIHAVRLWTMVLDISVHMASFPSKEIAIGSYNYRTLGLGYANLGGLLMRMALPYDSDEGRSLAAAITALIHFGAYKTSNEMAIEVGPFPRWEANKEPMQKVIDKHREALVLHINHSEESNRCILKAQELAYSIDGEVGFRNAQVTNIAPTGTISFVMDCDTTGMEPDFALVKRKKLAGGGTMTIANQGIEPALLKLGYDIMAARRAANSIVAGSSLTIAGIKPEHQPIFYCANEINPMAHVDMLAVVQPFLSGAASKTINMPRTATVEAVSDVYRHAWKSGVKAISLYRDGSKLTQPLSSAEIKTEVEHERKKEFIDTSDIPEASEEWFKKAKLRLPKSNGHDQTHITPQREMLPWRRTNGFTQKVKIGEKSIFLRVSEYPDGRPGEIFLDLDGEGSTLRAMANHLAIAISVGLQHGIPAGEYVKHLLHSRFEPSGYVEGHDQIKFVTSIADYIGKELAISYCGRDDLVQGKVKQASDTIPIYGTSEKALEVEVSVGYASGVLPQPSGGICPGCHNASLRRTGTCVSCEICPYNTGCG